MVRVWNRVDGTQLGAMGSHHFRISAVLFSPGSATHIVSVGCQEDQMICVWDRVKLQKLASAKISGRVSIFYGSLLHLSLIIRCSDSKSRYHPLIKEIFCSRFSCGTAHAVIKSPNFYVCHVYLVYLTLYCLPKVHILQCNLLVSALILDCA